MGACGTPDVDPVLLQTSLQTDVLGPCRDGNIGATWPGRASRLGRASERQREQTRHSVPDSRCCHRIGETLSTNDHTVDLIGKVDPNLTPTRNKSDYVTLIWLTIRFGAGWRKPAV
jgi:hypothetical protein